MLKLFASGTEIPARTRRMTSSSDRATPSCFFFVTLRAVFKRVPQPGIVKHFTQVVTYVDPRNSIGEGNSVFRLASVAGNPLGGGTHVDEG